MGARWNIDGLANSRRIWLPIRFEGVSVALWRGGMPEGIDRFGANEEQISLLASK